MSALLDTLSHQIYLSAPLFVLIFLGYSLTRFGKWPASISEGMNRFVFNVALPCMLFRVMSDFYKSPPVDFRLLLAFFGSCLLVFITGRICATRLFGLDGVAGSVFALGGIFSNNVMLGIPVATVLLGPQALPSVALVLVFNSLILWTLLTLSVEWSKHGSFSLKGLSRTLISVLKNPLIIGILSGTLWSFYSVRCHFCGRAIAHAGLDCRTAVAGYAGNDPRALSGSRRPERELYHLYSEINCATNDHLGHCLADSFAPAGK